MMKRLFCAVSAALTMLAAVPLCAYPSDGALTETVGDVTYTYTSDGTSAVITGAEGETAQLAVPETLGGVTVTQIGERAFFGMDGIESVTLPQTVSSIGGSAFAGCLSLKNITLPDSVETLGSSCFISCSSLESAVLGASLTAIPERCFYSCTSLSSVEIPQSVTAIGAEAFFSCTDLLALTVPKTVTQIGESAIGMQYNIRSGVDDIEGFVLTCEWDSAAQDYAEENGLKYEVYADFTPGDVNSDGLVDPADASLILAENANTSGGAPASFNEKQLLAADFNRDGLIDSADASLILVANAEQAS